MNVALRTCLLGLVLTAVPGAFAQGGASAVVLTYEEVYVTPEGAREVLATGRVYLTPRTDGRFRIDRWRAVDGGVEQITEIRNADRRITINHGMQVALWGPASTWWEVPSLAPMATVRVPAAAGERHHEDSAEQRKTGRVMTIGPAILLAWEGRMEDGTRVISWQDQQSTQVVATEIRMPDGAMTGETITSAARTVLDGSTFEIPIGYAVRSVARGEQR